MSIRNPSSVVVFLSLLTLHVVSAFADSYEANWHQWRGPNANGVSATGHPPTEWGEGKNIKWKAKIDGRGTSTPIIWGEKVFVLTAIDTGVKDASIPNPEDQPKTNFFDIKRPNTEYDFVVLCLDRDSGTEIWRKTATTKIPHEGAHNDNDFASASPTTDGRYLFCWFGFCRAFIVMTWMGERFGSEIWVRPKLVPVSAKAVLRYSTTEN